MTNTTVRILVAWVVILCFAAWLYVAWSDCKERGGSLTRDLFWPVVECTKPAP